MILPETFTEAAPVAVGVAGAAGRMGRQLLQAIAERPDARLAAALEREGQACIGQDTSLLAAGEVTGVQVGSDAIAVARACDVLVDFTTPAATLALLEVAVQQECAVVVGTTGIDADGLTGLKRVAERVPVVFAANYSAGVTVAMNLLREAARALGDGYDIEIIEAHHRHKLDAPSGTALAMGEAVADALQRDLSQVAVYGREGIGSERDPATIGFATVRAGDIIGEHTVMFAGAGERLEITHRAGERMTFARGAIRAACWVAGCAPGLYDMRDVLGLSSASARPSSGATMVSSQPTPDSRFP